MKRKLVRWGGAAVAAFLLVSLVVHLPIVQHAMGWTNRDGAGACPFGNGSTRVAAAPSPLRTGTAAWSRPALGFKLAATTRDELLAWAHEHGIACTATRGGTQLECADVPAVLLADHGGDLPSTSTWFELDDRGVLYAIRTLRRTEDVTRLARAFAATTAALTARAGTATRSAGSSAPATLASGAFQQASREYDFRDYRAVIRATNMGDGFVLTESYTSFN